MANEKRVRALAVGGLVEDNPLAAAGTTLTSAGLAALPAIGSTEHAAIIFDPDGSFGGAPFVKYVTAHTLGAPTATITAAAQEGTTARQIDRDTPWIHGPTVQDWDGAGGGSGLIGLLTYDPGTLAQPAFTATALTVVDATNVKVSFMAPPSGKVLHEIAAGVHNSGTVDGSVYVGLVDASNAAIAASAARVAYKQNVVQRSSWSWLETGLTAGTTYERRMAVKVGSAGGEAASVIHGGGYGSIVHKVLAVNL